MAPLDAEGLDVGSDRFGHSQPVQRQQRDQCMLSRRAQPGGDKERSDLVAVQAYGVGLVIDPGPADVDCRRVGDQAFLFGIAVEAGHGAESPGDRGRSSASAFELTAEGFDVTSANLEQLEVALVTEGDELAEVQGEASRVRPR